MKTLQEQWREYRDAVYPKGFGSAMQNQQVHQAFFAGALCTFQTITGLHPLPEDEGAKLLGVLEREITATCKVIVRPMPGGRN